MAYSIEMENWQKCASLVFTARIAVTVTDVLQTDAGTSVSRARWHATESEG